MTLITWKISITLKIYLKSKTKCRKCLSHNKWTTRYHFSWFQDTKESVNLLLQLADGFVAKGNLHAASIRQWCTAVDKRYKDFSSRMDRYRHKLESKLGVKEQVPVCIQTTFSLLSRYIYITINFIAKFIRKLIPHCPIKSMKAFINLISEICWHSLQEPKEEQRHSDSSLEDKVLNQAPKELTEEKRRSARKRE